jgi:hypothetical protein
MPSMLNIGIGVLVVRVGGSQHDVTRAHRIFSVQRMRLDGDVDAGGTVWHATTSETRRASVIWKPWCRHDHLPSPRIVAEHCGSNEF